jgi:hypothetical protein
MDTSILHTRIDEFKAKAKHPVSQEMIKLFESWFLTLENYLSEVELDNFELNNIVHQQQEMISLLSDIIIITGNADKLYGINLNDQYVKDAINLLLISKDRKNHCSLNAISALLYIHSDKKFESIKQLKEYASGK